MKFLIFFFLLSSSTYASQRSIGLTYEVFQANSSRQGDEHGIIFSKKNDFSAQIKRRSRYDQVENLLVAGKTWELMPKLFIDVKSSIGVNSISFEQYSLKMGMNYYAIAPFNFFLNFTNKHYRDVSLNQLNTGLHWESRSGFLLLGQAYISRVKDDLHSETTIPSYSFKVIYLGKRLEPNIFYSFGKEASVLFPGRPLSVYKTISYGAGVKYKISSKYFLSFNYTKLDLTVLKRKFDFITSNFIWSW